MHTHIDVVLNRESLLEIEIEIYSSICRYLANLPPFAGQVRGPQPAQGQGRRPRGPAAVPLKMRLCCLVFLFFLLVLVDRKTTKTVERKISDVNEALPQFWFP